MFINEVPHSAELSAIIVNELRDLYGIKFRKDKKLKSHQQLNHQKIFGVPLSGLEFTEVKLSNGALCRIPLFVSDACSRIMDQIEMEGIFRKAGSAARQKEIREKLEMGIPLDDTCNVIDVASILKYFFRELPDPLLPPGNFQESILRCLLCKGTHDRKIAAIKLVLLLLPNATLNTLVYFMQFLNLVSLHSASNKMSSKNLAIILTPGLMPIIESYGKRLNSHVQVIEILIDNAHDIGLVPAELLNRIPNLDFPESMVGDSMNYTMVASASRRSMEPNQIKVPETDIKKKKKRRSGSLTRMFNGFRKIVGAIGSTENLDDSHESEVQATPLIHKSKKRKALESSAFSSKKKKDVLSLLPSGGILPSTPMASTKNKPVKKSRLSLGGKRYSKNGSQQSSQSNGTKSSIVSSLERRWSFMVAGSGTRDNNNQKPTLNTIEDTIVSSSKQQKPIEVDEPWDSQITKSEYEEIKERVTAIESKISKEFTKLRSSLSNNSLDSVDNNEKRNGPERVLEKFERTLEETEMMNASPMTEQLAKHLSRGLKIRSSENKVFRSPSARKIGSIRRRSSQDNVRLTRNKSWHLGPNRSPLMPKCTRTTRNSPLQPMVTMMSPNIEKHVQIPRANLKRGRPNTFQNGLRCAQQSTTEISKPNEIQTNNNTFIVTDNVHQGNKNDDPIGDLKNEQWICANAFFDNCHTPNMNDESMLNSSKTSAKTSAKVKPARKRLNMNFDITPTNQPSPSVSTIDTMKTPMLPPRLPMVKKTPAKTPHVLTNRNNVFTPLWQQEQQQIAGRASIARLRSQNAGMVMAKAKLFDELVVDQPNARKVTRVNSKPDTRLSIANGKPDQENKPILEASLRNRLNQSRTTTNSPRRPKAAVSGVNRRQQLRAQRHTPTKKTPICLDKSLVSISNRITRNTPSPSMQSPRRISSIDGTPHASLITKPPRRIITPQNKRKPF